MDCKSCRQIAIHKRRKAAIVALKRRGRGIRIDLSVRPVERILFWRCLAFARLYGYLLPVAKWLGVQQETYRVCWCRWADQRLSAVLSTGRTVLPGFTMRPIVGGELLCSFQVKTDIDYNIEKMHRNGYQGFPDFRYLVLFRVNIFSTNRRWAHRDHGLVANDTREKGRKGPVSRTLPCGSRIDAVFFSNYAVMFDVQWPQRVALSGMEERQ
jgi:hypothetical protein